MQYSSPKISETIHLNFPAPPNEPLPLVFRPYLGPLCSFCVVPFVMRNWPDKCLNRLIWCLVTALIAHVSRHLR